MAEPLDCSHLQQTICGIDVHVIDVMDEANKGKGSEPSSTLIFLPGRGSLGAKYADRFLTGKFLLPSDLPPGGVRIVFPSSPIIDEHEDLPTWFRYAEVPAPDINSASRYVLSDLEFSASLIHKLFMHEVSRCGWARTFLGGHSQGAILALHVQLTKLEQPVAGLALFSGYVIHPLRQLISLADRKASLHLSCDLHALSTAGRFFVWHGELDENFPSKPSLELYYKLAASVGCSAALKMVEEAPGIAHSPVPPEAYTAVFSAMFDVGSHK